MIMLIIKCIHIDLIQTIKSVKIWAAGIVILLFFNNNIKDRSPPYFKEPTRSKNYEKT